MSGLVGLLFAFFPKWTAFLDRELRERLLGFCVLDSRWSELVLKCVMTRRRKYNDYQLRLIVESWIDRLISWKEFFYSGIHRRISSLKSSKRYKQVSIPLWAFLEKLIYMAFKILFINLFVMLVFKNLL